MKQSLIKKIIDRYLRGHATIMFAYRGFQYDFFTGADLGLGTTWRTIYTGDYQKSFPAGWYPKEFDLEAFKAVAEKNYLMPLGEDH
jgi:hypothetical protein